MKELVVILAIVGLLVFGAYMAAEGLHSAGLSFAEGQRHQATAAIAVAQIEAQTQIRLKELQMLEAAYTRSLAAAIFWPVAAAIGLLLAGSVWFLLWREVREARRQRSGYGQRQLTGAWYPALPATHYTRWETLQMERDYREDRR